MADYKRTVAIANLFLGEDTDPRVTSLQQNKQNLITQNSQLQDKIKQNNIKIADLDKQLAQLGSSPTETTNTNGQQQ